MSEDDVSTFLTRQTIVDGVVLGPHHRRRCLLRASVLDVVPARGLVMIV